MNKAVVFKEVINIDNNIWTPNINIININSTKYKHHNHYSKMKHSPNKISISAKSWNIDASQWIRINAVTRYSYN